MFGKSFFNKAIKSNGNVQVSGDAGNIVIGIRPEDHFKEIEKRVAEIKREQEKFIEVSLSALKNQADEAKNEAAKKQSQIDKLEDILRSPELYFDYADNSREKK